MKYVYTIVTLADITRTRPLRADPDHLKQSQQQNFNSLKQAIELRSNILKDKDPVRLEGEFPEPLKGNGSRWEYEFDVEREDVFTKDRDPVGLLKDDLDGVPFISQLNNTQDFDVPVFKTKGKDINTLILYYSVGDK